MPITKTDVVRNMDTGQELKVNTPVNGRVTRSTLHRILKRYGIKHDVGLPLDGMINLMQVHNIPLDPVKPGPVTDLEGNVIDFNPESKKKLKLDYAADGFPKQFGKLKAFAKETGIKFGRDVKRKELVSMLNEHLDSQI